MQVSSCQVRHMYRPKEKHPQSSMVVETFYFAYVFQQMVQGNLDHTFARTPKIGCGCLCQHNNHPKHIAMLTEKRKHLDCGVA